MLDTLYLLYCEVFFEVFIVVLETDDNSGIQILAPWRRSQGEWEVVEFLYLTCSS